MPLNQSGKSSVDLMGLAASGAVAGLVVATLVEAGAGCVPGCLTVMAQFIFMTASFSLEGRPRIAGPGVSATYQYDYPAGLRARVVWLPSGGPMECTI